MRIAAATGYQESYVRWLLKQVYRKQGLSGQVALVQLDDLAACRMNGEVYAESLTISTSRAARGINLHRFSLCRFC